MDYKQKYEKALERAKYYLSELELGDTATCVFREVFPELKESEDEKIRKELIEYFRWNAQILNDFNNKDVIAWLEKQGEQKTANEVELKFKIGDCVVSPNGVYWHIDAILDGRYQVSSDSGDSADWPLDTNIYHRFTIQDAKDGNVLFTTCANTNETVFIYRGIEFDAAHCYFLYSLTNNECKIFNSVCSVKADIHPATKEQRDLLFQKMKEAGYEWDAEKKELKKIEHKPFWSENIQQKYIAGVFEQVGLAEIARELANDNLTNALQDAMVELSKNVFKNYWSKEDEKNIEMINNAIDFASNQNLPRRIINDGDKYMLKDWLKSLKPRWKPTEEQIKSLRIALQTMPYSKDKEIALSLLEQLKTFEQ